MQPRFVSTLTFTLSLFITITLLPASAMAEGAAFWGLGQLEGATADSSRARGGSPTLGTVVGTAGESSSLEAFRWDDTNGMIGLGDLPGGADYSWANAASEDGDVVVGLSEAASGTEAFRWDPVNGMVGLGSLASGPFGFSDASDVSADGSVIVGQTAVGSGFPPALRAFRWDAVNGMVQLGVLPGGQSSNAFAITPDGSKIVGQSHSSIGFQATLWDPVDGITPLGRINPTDTSSAAIGISADGDTIVGWSTTTAGKEAFRWTEALGMTGLGDLPGGDFYSEATGVSGDGSRIVGVSSAGSGIDGRRAFIWDETSGMQQLDLVLTALGVDLTGWTLTFATALSSDGNTIAGWGTNPAGQTEAWIAMIPEPSTALLVGLGLFGLAGRRRAHRVGAR